MCNVCAGVLSIKTSKHNASATLKVRFTDSTVPEPLTTRVTANALLCCGCQLSAVRKTRLLSENTQFHSHPILVPPLGVLPVVQASFLRQFPEVSSSLVLLAYFHILPLPTLKTILSATITYNGRYQPTR